MRFRNPLAGVAAAVMALSLVAFDGPDDDDLEGPRPPADYIAMADDGELSQPTYTEVIHEKKHVTSWDGTEIYVEVTRPDPSVYGDETFPVILESAPYHGTIADRDGTRIFPDPKDANGDKVGLTGFFAPRGYAVVMMDLRGTGRSGGCLDHLGPNDAKDLKLIVEWAASQEWSAGKVGMTGHSYVGSTPKVAAAMRPEGLATIVPSAGLASMYDHQFQSGVPYLLQYIGPMVAYEALALDRHLPPFLPSALGDQTGDDFGNHVTDTGCGLKNSAAISGTGQVTGEYQLWHAQRDWRDAAADADIPVFMIHGVNDNAARIPAAEWFFGDRFDRENDKVWIGQWDHGSTNGRCGDESNTRTLHPTCRFDQFQEALHAWFDKHLKGMDVDTGPAVEAFLNGERATPLNQVVDPATEAWGTNVFTADAWTRDATRVEVYPDATTGTLLIGDQPESDGSATFRNGANGLLAHVSAGKVTFVSEPFEEDTVIVGLPRMQLDVSVTSGEIIHLVAELNRVDPIFQQKQPMTTCAIQPQLRFGVETLAPVVPLEEMTMTPTCFTMAHFVPAGQHLELEIDTVSPHHASFGGTDAQVTVFTGPGRTGFLLPVQEDATVFPDVPLRRS